MVHHTYFRQLHNGLPVINAVGSIHLSPDLELLHASHSFLDVDPTFFWSWYSNDQPTPVISSKDALIFLLDHIGLEYTSLNQSSDTIFNVDLFPTISVDKKYLNVDDKFVLVYDLDIDLDENWFHAQVDAADGQVLQLIDWVSHSSFNVYPIGYNSPLNGARKLIESCLLCSEAISYQQPSSNTFGIKLLKTVRT